MSQAARPRCSAAPGTSRPRPSPIAPGTCTTSGATCTTRGTGCGSSAPPSPLSRFHQAPALERGNVAEVLLPIQVRTCVPPLPAGKRGGDGRGGQGVRFLLALLTLAVYLPVLAHGFLRFDDPL